MQGGGGGRRFQVCVPRARPVSESAPPSPGRLGAAVAATGQGRRFREREPAGPAEPGPLEGDLQGDLERAVPKAISKAISEASEQSRGRPRVGVDPRRSGRGAAPPVPRPRPEGRPAGPRRWPRAGPARAPAGAGRVAQTACGCSAPPMARIQTLARESIGAGRIHALARAVARMQAPGANARLRRAAGPSWIRAAGGGGAAPCPEAGRAQEGAPAAATGVRRSSLDGRPGQSSSNEKRLLNAGSVLEGHCLAESESPSGDASWAAEPLAAAPIPQSLSRRSRWRSDSFHSRGATDA